MQAERGKAEDVLPFDSRGHPHTSITFMRPYALHMQPHAPITHFCPASRNRPGSRTERTSKKPYALYAPLLGVGAFSAFFLLREPHTAAYGSHRNPALALPPVGIEASSARRKQKRIRIRIRIFADSRRNRPPMKSIRLRPSLIPFDAPAVFCPWKRFFGPSDGLSSFQAIVVVPIHTVPQGAPRIRFSGDGVFGNEKRPENVIVFSGGFMRLMTASQGGPWVIRQSQAIGDPLSGPSRIKTGGGLWWTI